MFQPGLSFQVSVRDRIISSAVQFLVKLQLILLVMSQCALVPEIAAPESISHGGDCRVNVAIYTVRGMNMLS